MTAPVGSVLSTRTVIAAEVKALPALSVVTTRRSYWPSACAVVSQLAAWFVQVPAPVGERWNWTVSTPEPPASAELLVSATVPRTFGGVGRAVTVPVGSVLSTRTWTVAGVASAFPADVGGEDAQVVEAVGEPGRVERGAVRRRRVGRDVRPGAGAGGRALEGDGVDGARRGVGGERGQCDGGAAQVAPAAGGDRAGRPCPVDSRQDELCRLAAGIVGGADAEQARAVGRDRPGDGVGRRRVGPPSDVQVSAAQVGGRNGALLEADAAMPLPASVAVAVRGVGSAVGGLTGLATLTERRRDGVVDVTVIVAEVKALPALSVVATRRS